MKTDLVIHVDTDDKTTFALALGNIVNYTAALPQAAEHVTMLANGRAVRLFRLEHPVEEKTIRELAEQGVRFALCANALKKFDLERNALLDICTVVPAGVVELVRLQNEGYAYVKP